MKHNDTLTDEQRRLVREIAELVHGTDDPRPIPVAELVQDDADDADDERPRR